MPIDKNAAPEHGPVSMSLNCSRLVELAASSGLDVRLRSESPGIWDELGEQCEYLPVSYTGFEIDYQTEYVRDQTGVDIREVSLILMHDRRPAALWPLNIRTDGEITIFDGLDGKILPPLFLEQVGLRVRKELCKRCFAFLDEIVRLPVSRVNDAVDFFVGDTGRTLSPWHLVAAGAGYSIAVLHDLFVDLSLDLPAIKSRFRKSYRSLVNSGMRLWKAEILDCRHEDIWSEFRELHRVVAGKSTRSPRTWEMQLDSIAAGRAFLVTLRDEPGRMVGGGLFSLTRDEGRYDVAAYDRNLFDKPLGHLVQFKAIEELKKRKVRWYRIGPRAFPGEFPQPTEKVLSIGAFKEGFSTNVFPCYVFRRV